jgi:hypothetical protein
MRTRQKMYSCSFILKCIFLFIVCFKIFYYISKIFSYWRRRGREGGGCVVAAARVRYHSSRPGEGDAGVCLFCKIRIRISSGEEINNNNFIFRARCLICSKLGGVRI